MRFVAFNESVNFEMLILQKLYFSYEKLSKEDSPCSFSDPSKNIFQVHQRLKRIFKNRKEMKNQE